MEKGSWRGESLEGREMGLRDWRGVERKDKEEDWERFSSAIQNPENKILPASRPSLDFPRLAEGSIFSIGTRRWCQLRSPNGVPPEDLN